MDTQKTKNDLLISAKSLHQPSESAAQEFSQKSEALAAKGSSLFSKRPDIDEMVGEKNIGMAHDNNRNFARFMVSMFEQFDPTVMVETVLWVFRAYRSHGFHTTYWPANLNIWVELIQGELSKETYESIYPFYNWLIINIPLFATITDEDLAQSKAELS